MARGRSETLSSFGRAPARSGRLPPMPKGPLPEPGGGNRGAVRSWLRGALFDNLPLKFLSLVLAVTVFLLVNTDEEREISVRVDVAYEYPADKVLVSEPLEEIRISIKGPWRRLKQFDERQLQRITLDLRNAPTGDIPLTPNLIEDLPPGLSVTSVSPRTVRVAFDNVATKVVEVVPSTVGRPAYGFVATEIKPVPASVQVRGGSRVLAALRSVSTVAMPLDGKTETFEAPVELDVPEGVAIDPPQRVDLRVKIGEELVIRSVPGIAIEVRTEDAAGLKYTSNPALIDVTLTGALLAVERAKAGMRLVVTVGPAELKAREAPVRIEGLPPGVGVRLSPERVKLVLPSTR